MAEVRKSRLVLRASVEPAGDPRAVEELGRACDKALAAYRLEFESTVTEGVRDENSPIKSAVAVLIIDP